VRTSRIICAILYLLLLTILVADSNAVAGTNVTRDGERVTIENDRVALTFNLKSGSYDVRDKVHNVVPIKDAFFQAEGQFSKARTETIEWTQQDVNDVFGKGKTVIVTARYRDYADTRWEATLYDDKEFITFTMGIVNDSKRPYTLTTYYPLKSYNVLRGMGVKENFCALNGNSGANRTYAKDTTILLCFNNMMIRCGDLKNPNILVTGGLTYHDFEKFCSFTKLGDSLNLQLWAEDPVGKLIDPGTSYKSDDRFYLCVSNANPFEAMEKYGLAVRAAQDIHLNYYDFPTECLWYATVYAQDPNRRKFNDTKGALEEMDNAIKSGFTKYSRVAIRLVPDAYGPDNQQGWWNDEHWAMWGDKMSADGANYVPPYLSSESWCQEILRKGGLPMTYIQTNQDKHKP